MRKPEPTQIVQVSVLRLVEYVAGVMGFMLLVLWVALLRARGS